MRKYKLKKVLAICSLSISLLTIGAISTNAASQNFSFSFNSGGTGSAYVDGSANGKFYSLNSGKVYMKVTSFKATGYGDTAVVTLKRQQSGFDANYGSNSIAGTGTFTWDVNTNSSKYYIYARGNDVYTQYDVSGTISN